MERKLPEGWETVIISSLCEKIETVNPLTEPHQEFGYIDIDSIDNISHCITQPKVMLGLCAPSRARQKVSPGDILFSTVRPYLKNIAIIPNNLSNLVASTGFSILRVNEEITRKYLYYYLLTDHLHENLSLLYRGANYPAISNTDLKSQVIPLPPIDTQRQIVAILEKAETIRRLRAESDALTQRLLQSVFLEMFGDPVTNPMGWEISTLGDVCLLIKDGPHISPNYVDNGVPFITVHNVNEGSLNFSNARFISESDYHGYFSQYYPETGIPMGYP